MDKFFNGVVLIFLAIVVICLVAAWIFSLIDDLKGRGRGGGIFITIILLIALLGGTLGVLFL